MKFILTIVLLSGQLMSQSLGDLRQKVLRELQGTEGTFAVAFEDLSTGAQFLLNEREMFHAASTMKTPVMLEVYRQAAAGKFRLTDSLVVKNDFRSIVDGSAYSLDFSEDSDDAVYKLSGKSVPIQQLVFQMITVSSNFATNLLIGLVGASNVNSTIRSLGADSLTVLRGVEDSKAFQAGLNNRTSALDLLLVFKAIFQHRAVDSSACESMLRVLDKQRFREIIPAQLPDGLRIAHKTGSITGVEHDSGVVWLKDGRAYVVVLLSKNLKEPKKGKDALARVSRLLYDSMTTTR